VCAHGVYIARESATHDPGRAGFGHVGRDVDVAGRCPMRNGRERQGRSELRPMISAALQNGQQRTFRRLWEPSAFYTLEAAEQARVALLPSEIT
jgi:hypothetical protein